MKNANLKVAVWMSQHFGIRNNAWKLSDKTGIPEDKFSEAMLPMIAVGVEMYDIAEGIRLGDCRDPAAIFKAYAHWFAVQVKDTGKLPEDNDCVQAMSDCVFNGFTQELTHEQDNILRNRLNAEVKEYVE